MAASISLAKATIVPAVSGPNPSPAYQTVRYVASPDGAAFYDFSTNDPNSVEDANTFLQANITSLVAAAVASGRLIANAVNGAVVGSTQVTSLHGTPANAWMWERLLIVVFRRVNVTVDPTITVGITSGGSDILASRVLSGFASSPAIYQLNIPMAASPISSLSSVTDAPIPIWVNVTNAATGASPQFSFTVTPIGKNALDF